MYFLYIILCIVSMAVPFTNTGILPWKSYTEVPAISGCAAYYAEGRMESTAVVLGHIDKTSEYKKWLADSGYIGAVAVYRLGDKGRDVHILWPDGTIDGPYLAIDVVARNHYSLAVDKNRVVDIDYSTAEKYSMRGPIAVTIIYDHTWLFSLGYRGNNTLLTSQTTDKYKGCMGKTNVSEVQGKD